MQQSLIYTTTMRNQVAYKFLTVPLSLFLFVFITFKVYVLLKVVAFIMVSDILANQKVSETSEVLLSQPPTSFLEDANETNNSNTVTIKREFFEYLALRLQDSAYPGIHTYLHYMIAHLGLIGLDNVELLNPEYEIVVNDVRSIDYKLTVPACRAAASNLSMFIAVTSAPRNFEKRQMIRETWLRHTVLYPQQLDVVGVAFVLGTTHDMEADKAVALEHDAHGDILQVDMFDTYYNLSLKDTGLFNWLDVNCASVDYVLRIDDDVYVNFSNLVRIVKLLDPSQPAIYGSISGSLPHRGTFSRTINFETK